MSMYQPHRPLGPATGNARLNELLDGIRAEFETQVRASGEYEHSSKPFHSAPRIDRYIMNRASPREEI